MKINFVMPTIASKQSGSAGHLMVYEYAKRLREKGHEISITPLVFYGKPDIDAYISYDRRSNAFKRVKSYWNKALSLLNKKRKLQTSMFVEDRFDEIKNAIVNMPDCDVNIATAYQTVLPVYLSNKGVPFYFIQHFEELFNLDSPFYGFCARDAALTYNLPIHKITNSTWVTNQITSKYRNQKVTGMVNNAIDTGLFFPREVNKSGRIRVLTHSGRNKEWKGFPDAVSAMKLVREKYPDVEWWVFGDEGLVPPENDVARYHSCGFVKYHELPELYSSADIVLCPSWYESFPMPPIEAMACGTAVVTTPFGAEDYARDGENCLIVSPKDPHGMAEAVIRLIEDRDLRTKLEREGINTASGFTWDIATAKFENILLSHCLAGTK
jgi:glycosyltransferase involved in cell wall biosynthesis